MNHMEIHKLEREIADVLMVGFLRPPQPTEKGFDRADCVQAAHDIAEMLLANYRVDEHVYLGSDAVPGSLLELMVNRLGQVKDDLHLAAEELNKSSALILSAAGLTGEEVIR